MEERTLRVYGGRAITTKLTFNVYFSYLDAIYSIFHFTTLWTIVDKYTLFRNIFQKYDIVLALWVKNPFFTLLDSIPK